MHVWANLADLRSQQLEIHTLKRPKPKRNEKEKTLNPLTLYQEG